MGNLHKQSLHEIWAGEAYGNFREKALLLPADANMDAICDCSYCRFSGEHLRCSLCPVSEGLTRESGFIDPALFRLIVDEGAPYVFLMIPAKLLAVIAYRNLRHRTYLRHFFKTVPLLIVALYSWCLGELVACVRPNPPIR
jgi:hypothetical protein